MKSLRDGRTLLVAAFLAAGICFAPALAGAQDTSVGQPAGEQGPGPQATGAGILKKALFFSESALVRNSDVNNFANAFSVQVSLGGRGVQCVKIQYSGEMSLEANTDEDVSGSFRALLDGALMEGHSTFGQNFVSPDDALAGRFETVGFHNWKCDVAPGLHTIQVQFKPVVGANAMTVRGRSLTVHYKR